MLLTERFSEYDKLAKKLASRGFAFYKEVLTGKEGYNIKATFKDTYQFPIKGLLMDKYPVALHDISKCVIKFSLMYNFTKNISDMYYFNGSYSSNANHLFIILNILGFDKMLFKQNFNWQEFYFKLLRTIRHELEHQVQYFREGGIPVHHYDTDKDAEIRKSKFFKSQDSVEHIIKTTGRLPKIQARYTTLLPSEVEAQLKSIYLISKKTKKSMHEVLVPVLLDYELPYWDVRYVIDVWEEYRKKHFSYMPPLD